ncbi:MAG: hypothetical protein WCR48_00365 [Bacteroidales bacterium]
MKQINILYIHGMGGGGDSRIPSILNEQINAKTAQEADAHINVIIRTYDFNPEIAEKQIALWVQETSPSLIVGESLGSILAMALSGFPHILVSPSLNAPLYFDKLAFLAGVPGVTALADWYFRPKEGDRQQLHFTYSLMKKWGPYREKALANSPARGGADSFFAFFGTRDNYRKTGIVRVTTYRKYFGDRYQIFKGSHYMPDDCVVNMLIPKILETLGLVN